MMSVSRRLVSLSIAMLVGASYAHSQTLGEPQLAPPPSPQAVASGRKDFPWAASNTSRQCVPVSAAAIS